MSKSLFKDYIIYDATDFQTYLSNLLTDGVICEKDTNLYTDTLYLEPTRVIMQGMYKELDEKAISFSRNTKNTLIGATVESVTDTAVDFKPVILVNGVYEDIADNVAKENSNSELSKKYLYVAHIANSTDEDICVDTRPRVRKYDVSPTDNAITNEDNYFIPVVELNYPLVFDENSHHYNSCDEMMKEASNAICNMFTDNELKIQRKAINKARRLTSKLPAGRVYPILKSFDEDFTNETTELIEDTGKLLVSRTITMTGKSIQCYVIYLNGLLYEAHNGDGGDTLTVTVSYKDYIRNTSQPIRDGQVFTVKILVKDSA